MDVSFIHGTIITEEGKIKIQLISSGQRSFLHKIFGYENNIFIQK